jgi:hypothetical protein
MNTFLRLRRRKKVAEEAQKNDRIYLLAKSQNGLFVPNALLGILNLAVLEMV